MSTPSKTDRIATSPDVKQPATKEKTKEKETARETIESIIFAFVLAFLFRTFEAEAFVIPTGSMAPTLFGRHKDIDCEQCGFSFQFGASREVAGEGQIITTSPGRIRKATCPNCRFENTSAYEAAPFKGDRILVNKFQYELADPKRFDVVVFKYPVDPKTNFIKRLVGLPGETVRIHHGNVYRVEEGGGETILRKDDVNKMKDIQIPVYDDRYPPTALVEAGWPNRWGAVAKNIENGTNTVAEWSEIENSWELDPASRTYSLPAEKANGQKQQWLRYRHFTPTAQDWTRLENGADITPAPRLVGDFCGYNGIEYAFEMNSSQECFWVGDLSVSGKVVVGEKTDSSVLTLELVEGLHWYRCHLDLNSGQARLTRIEAGLDPNDEIELATANTNVGSASEFKFYFSNVDDRLSLWIDDSLVDFEEPTTYESSQLHGMMPTELDFTPVGIAAQGASVSVKDLVIDRDIYYRGLGNFANGDLLLSNVSEWQRVYRNRGREADFFEITIPENEFFVLGDNSPESSDGRLWPTTHTVPRNAFVGKAFFIYWPHGIPIGLDQGAAIPVSYHKKVAPNGQIVSDRSYPMHYIPFYPNFWRMHRIR